MFSYLAVEMGGPAMFVAADHGGDASMILYPIALVVFPIVLVGLAWAGGNFLRWLDRKIPG